MSVYDTVPETGVVPCVNVNVAVLIVEGFISSLKVAWMVVLILLPSVLSAGVAEVTSGQMPSRPASSVTFLQPVAKTTSSRNMNHLLLKIVE